jgi:anti-anti-sigma factor
MVQPPASFVVRAVDGAHVFELQQADMTDGALIQRVGDEIYRALRDLERPRVVVDFHKVRKLSSATLGMLVALSKVIDRKDGVLRVSSLRKDLESIFRITNLHDVFKLCQSTDEAVASFEK